MSDAPPSLSAAVDRLRHVPGATLTVEVERSSLSRAGEEHFTTFSREAIATNAVNLQAWVLTRLFAAIEARDEIPQAVRIAMRVNADDDAVNGYEFTWDRDWYSSYGDAPGRQPFSAMAVDALCAMFVRWLGEPLPRPPGRRMPQRMRLTVTAEVEFGDGPPGIPAP